MSIELSNPFLFFTVLLAVVLPAIFFLLLKWKKEETVLNKLPPGPRKLPILGDLLLMSTLPFRSFRDLSKKYGPIMYLKLGEVPVVVVSSPELTKLVLKDHDLSFADRPGSNAMKIMWYNYINIAFCPYGEYWRQMRRICILELLSTKNVRSFASIRNDQVSCLIKSVGQFCGKPFNLTDKIDWLTSSITCRTAFGKVCKDNDAFIRLVKEAIQMAAGFGIADLFPSSKIVNTLSWSTLRLLIMRRKLDVILDEIIEEHKQNRNKMDQEDDSKDTNSKCRGNGEFGNEDLIDVFLRVKEGGELQFPIHNENIKAVLFDMFAAGTETSSTAINWTMTELMRNPRVMAKAQAEIRELFKGNKMMTDEEVKKLKYLKLVIKETFRLHTPVPILPRCSREEITIAGYTIPSKVKVVVNNWAMHRDPKYWTDPETFCPERFENSSIDFVGGDFHYLPFGSGRRMCPGMVFGVANVEIPLAQLLYNFDWQLPDGVNANDLNMIESHGLAAARKDKLFVVPVPYVSCP